MVRLLQKPLGQGEVLAAGAPKGETAGWRQVSATGS
jgi:hypothetical protein